MIRKQSNGTKPRLSTRWVLIIGAVLVAYGLFQPMAKSRLGWNLPSLTSLIGQAGAVADGQSLGESNEANPTEPPAVTDRESSSGIDEHPSSSVTAAPGTNISATGTDAESGTAVGTFGYLREVGASDFLSPGGLRYSPGSQEGHRLKHLARHLEDAPDRPGLHGVFGGEMKQVLQWLDEAYKRARDGESGTTQRPENGRTVYEAKFSHSVGYVGGREGKRKRNPSASSIRLVTEGNRVITAFPF